MSDPRFEIVRGDSGFHVRFRASNGRVVLSSEIYARRRAALAAVATICGEPVYLSPFAETPEVDWRGNRERPTEVRDVDERGQR